MFKHLPELASNDAFFLEMTEEARNALKQHGFGHYACLLNDAGVRSFDEVEKAMTYLNLVNGAPDPGEAKMATFASSFAHDAGRTWTSIESLRIAAAAAIGRYEFRTASDLFAQAAKRALAAGQSDSACRLFNWASVCALKCDDMPVYEELRTKYLALLPVPVHVRGCVFNFQRLQHCYVSEPMVSNRIFAPPVTPYAQF